MIPWRRAWQPTLVFLPGESHGLGSLAGYYLCAHKESAMTEWQTLHFQGYRALGTQWPESQTLKLSGLSSELDASGFPAAHPTTHALSEIFPQPHLLTEWTQGTGPGKNIWGNEFIWGSVKDLQEKENNFWGLKNGLALNSQREVWGREQVEPVSTKAL